MRPGILYANAAVAVKSSKFLDEHQVRRMIAAASFSDAAHVLVECGYNPNIISSSEDDETKIIDDETKKGIDLFKQLCPDEFLKTAVLLPSDYHDAKILYKSRFDVVDVYDATYRFGTIPFESLVNSINKKEYTFLPSNMKRALVILDTIATPTADEIDTVFDKYLKAEVGELAENIKTPAVRQYVLTGDEGVLKDFDNPFSLEKFLKWFILKKREIAVVRVVLTGKKTEMSREKIRGLIKNLR